MLFDMVKTGRVQRQGQHVSRKFSRHKLRLLPILELSHARKALNYAFKAETAASASATVTVTIHGRFVVSESPGHVAFWRHDQALW